MRRCDDEIITFVYIHTFYDFLFFLLFLVLSPTVSRNILLFTTGGLAFGFFGARKPFRGPNSRFNMGIGLFAGLTYASLSSMQRFMGLEENASEVASYGVMKPDALKEYTRKANMPNFELIDSSDHK